MAPVLRPGSLWRWLPAAAAVLALVPLAHLGADWASYRRDVGLPLVATPPLGFDGVRWSVKPVAITAYYVAPGSPAARAGVRAGDRLDRLDGLPPGSLSEVERAVAVGAGAVLALDLRRGTRRVRADVGVVRAPTFLYPVSRRLWDATTWGFGIVTLLHLLAFATLRPLARRSVRSRRAVWLVGAALLWVAGNLTRVGWMSIGLPGDGPGSLRPVFDVLTLAALTGWIAFPALLLLWGLRTSPTVDAMTQRTRWLLLAPAVLLGGGLGVATLAGHLGPLPPDAFVLPVLSYVCVYVGVASAVTLAVAEALPPMLRAGHALVAGLGTAGAAFAWAVPATTALRDSPRVGGTVVALQLFSVLPVALVTLGSLRVGAFEMRLRQSVATAAVLGLVFLIVLGVEAGLHAFVPSGPAPGALAGLVVGLLAVSVALAPRVGRALRRWARGERREADRLDAFGDRVRDVLDALTLADEAAAALGAAFAPRSAVVFLRHPAGEDRPDGEPAWIRAAFRPEPPHFGDDELEQVWSTLGTTTALWARNPELSETTLPRAATQQLERLGVALALPVATRDEPPVGLLVLARKIPRFAIYTVADVSRLRGFAGQVALAAERLRLVEREKALVRQTAEAELVALRAQINPHFLFNALNTVASLIAERPDAAEETVENLAGLFRDVLTSSGQPLIPLADELRLVERYLAVEKARFGDGLTVEITCQRDVASCPVPAFAVQTLVENAVKHGIEARRGGGRVAISATRHAGSLTVEVHDSGVGIPELYASEHPGAFHGVGLTNVSRRLSQLYPDGTASLRHASTPDGTTATLTLPAC